MSSVKNKDQTAKIAKATRQIRSHFKLPRQYKVMAAMAVAKGRLKSIRPIIRAFTDSLVSYEVHKKTRGSSNAEQESEG